MASDSGTGGQEFTNPELTATLMTWEEFQRELADLPLWISKAPRTRRGWLYSVEAWARGDR